MAAGAQRGATTILLVRHGQSTGNVERRFGGHAEVPLTELGCAQAERLGSALGPLGPTALITSDLGRARQTAEAIAAATGVAPTVDPRWRERSLGQLDGMRFSEVRAGYPELWKRLAARDPTLVPPGGESAADVASRLSQALAHALSAHTGGTVVVVSHAIAIHFALATACRLAEPAPGSGVFFHVDNASVSHLRITGAHVRVERLNDVRHLAGLPD